MAAQVGLLPSVFRIISFFPSQVLNIMINYNTIVNNFERAVERKENREVKKSAQRYFQK